MDLKEKILGECADDMRDCFQFGNHLDFFDGQASTVFKAMDELSKIVAIAFGEWVISEGINLENAYWADVGKYLTTDKLYQLFTQSKEYKELMDQK